MQSKSFIGLGMMGYELLHHARAQRQVKQEMFSYIITFRVTTKKFIFPTRNNTVY